MALTQTQQLLFDGLNAFPTTRAQRIHIWLMMDNEAQMWEMMQYMKAHLEATGDELMAAAVRITGGLK